MASKTITHLIDDIDGSEAGNTIRFSVGGGPLVIDLNAVHAEEFFAAIDPYITHARHDSGHLAKPRRTPRTGNPGAVRQWAQANGYAVSLRGRIPANVVAAYEAAQA